MRENISKIFPYGLPDMSQTITSIMQTYAFCMYWNVYGTLQWPVARRDFIDP